ncbi:hypothetical protein FisN_4Hh433 [Fistulifera solaris]|uniref:DUF1995 domain-containing protein n=1 Tax=Fistulifera solaris TaxID=1519565 RepID=A0A1Z5KIC9_FISSO|nr:hypothetical protein FisN_4Hh433 [Fistulifera solaris]|eukprot:GAX26064.1 hypothetical protein FisN_4Hh433 [Fistulifera solaris]
MKPLLLLSGLVTVALSFQLEMRLFHRRQMIVTRESSRNNGNDKNDPELSSLVTARLPTSVDDQVRQCVQSIQLASADGTVRHAIRLLLPVIGATDLDDWPGGARQMMEAAAPMVEQIMIGLGVVDSTAIQKVCLDASDGVYAWMGQAESAANDCVFVLLPTAECVKAIRSLDEQVGPKRNLVLVNPQWRRRSDFGGFFGIDESSARYAEFYQPTFSLTNLICEGESVRILHNYNWPWRVYLREELVNGDVDWKMLGEKPFAKTPPEEGNEQPWNNKRDGGRLLDYGQPSYQEIIDMLKLSPGYVPKNPAERAAAAFAFIKDTL